MADVQAIVSGAIGGENVSETVEGRARFPINLRYPREWRDTPQRLVELPVLTPMGQQITLGTVARIAISDGPPMLKSENARPSGWVYRRRAAGATSPRWCTTCSARWPRTSSSSRA